MPPYRAGSPPHHWKGRLRPRHAYAVGLIDKTARVASLAPGLANVLGQAPGLSRLIKLAGGIAPQRQVPHFAPMTLQQWFFARGGRARRAAEPEAERTNLGRGERNLGGPRVLVW